MDTNNLALKNNLAMMALLLNATEHKPHDIARDVYTRASTNGYYASTYAFSLCLQQPSEAVKVFERVDAKLLEEPGRSRATTPWRCKARATRRKPRATGKRPAKTKLLPEEAATFKKAQRS